MAFGHSRRRWFETCIGVLNPSAWQQFELGGEYHVGVYIAISADCANR
jgi:hypothetical protein